MASFVDFAELKAAIRIEDVLPKLGLASLSRADQWRGPCPACESGGDRALVVTPAKQTFYCFAARQGGDVIGFVAHVRGCGMKEAALALAEWFDFDATPDRNCTSSRNSTSTESGNGTSPPERPVETKKLAPLSYLNPSHEAVLALGLSAETCEHFGAGYAPKGILRGRLAIPIHDPSGELAAYCGRAVKADQAPLLAFPKGFVRNSMCSTCTA